MRLLIYSFALLLGTYTSTHANSSVLAGIAGKDITPPIGVPLGGYGGPERRLKSWYDWGNKHKYATGFKPSKGVLDPIRSKTLVLIKGDEKLVFISLDLVGVTKKLTSDISFRLAKFGVKRKDLYVGATHTHSGPGALTRNRVLSLMAMDKFDRRVYYEILDKIEENFIEAMTKARPATLWETRFKHEGITRNRRKNPGHFDPYTNILLVKNENDEVLGTLFNLAVHGTSYGASNLFFSADFPGALERQVEARLQSEGAVPGAIAMFFNGAEGDVSPNGNIEVKAPEFANQFMNSLGDLRPVKPEWDSKMKSVFMGRAKFRFRPCIQSKWVNRLLWRHFGLGLGFFMPWRANVHRLRLGHIMMMSLPGEPTTSVGIALQDLMKEKGHDRHWVLGLTNGHLTYITTREEYKQATYEACTSFYGRKAASKLIKAQKKIID